MRISIIGLGHFGTPLAQLLRKHNHDVRGTTRSEEKAQELRAKGLTVEVLREGDLPDQDLLSVDTVILNIPPFEGELEWFKSWAWDFSQTRIIFISSTSVYGEAQGLVSEETPLRPRDPKPRVLAAEEGWVRANFKNWNILRFGGLVSEGRHPGKFLSGKKDLLAPRAPVNLLHLEDAMGFTVELLERNLTGEVFNVVSAFHPSREEFYTNYCREQGLPLPEFDQRDDSRGKIVDSSKAQKIYRFGWPRTT